MLLLRDSDVGGQGPQLEKPSSKFSQKPFQRGALTFGTLAKRRNEGEQSGFRGSSEGSSIGWWVFCLILGLICGPVPAFHE